MSEFEDYEGSDYDHDTTADELADAIYDAIIDRDWIKEVGLGAGGMLVTDVNGKTFLVKVQEDAGPAS